MRKYYDRKTMDQPDIEVSDLVMLNTKNIRAKGPLKKLSPKLYGLFKVLERQENRVYKLEISLR